METTACVEHRLRLRIRTALLMMTQVLPSMVGVVGFGIAVDLALVKEWDWKGAALIGVFSLLMALGFGWVVLRFVQRILNVKTVRVLAGPQLEITTRTRRKFMANLPDDIRYALLDRGFLTVAVEVEGRRFVLDSQEFSDSRQMNEFFRQFVKAEMIISAR